MQSLIPSQVRPLSAFNASSLFPKSSGTRGSGKTRWTGGVFLRVIVVIHFKDVVEVDPERFL